MNNFVCNQAVNLIFLHHCVPRDANILNTYSYFLLAIFPRNKYLFGFSALGSRSGQVMVYIAILGEQEV